MTQPPGPLPPALTATGVAALLRLAVLCVDQDGRISYWNRGAEELFGHRWDNVFGRRASGLLPAVAVPMPVAPRQMPANAGKPAAHEPRPGPYRDALERLDELTDPSWAGSLPVTDRDGRVCDVLWWSYRLVEPTGRSLLVLAANAKPLRTCGPRIAVGDQLRAYASVAAPAPGELRVAAGLAAVYDPVLAEQLSGRLGTILPRVSPPRLDRIMRQLVPLGYPVIEVDGAAPLAVLPQEGSGVLPGARARAAGAARDGNGYLPPSRRALEAGPAEPPGAQAPHAGPSSVDEQRAHLREAASGIGTSLDLDSTARELCAALVPRFADMATVQLVDRLISDTEPPKDQHPDEASVLRRIAVEHRIAEPVAELAPEGQLLSPATESATWGRLADALLISVVDPAIAEELAIELLGSAECVPLLSGRSLLVVPLVARGTLLGRLFMLRREDRPPFDDKDIGAAGELAARGAVSLDNARLHLMESRAATMLQRSMLPTRPPALPGVRIAHRYMPGDRQAQVGGDWFDAVQLPGGRVALIVGDVMGHGLHSAAVMGQFRTAVQTMAALDLPPAQLLRHLDNLAHRLGRDHLATCVYAVYDPIHRTLTLANAGHVPPVLARADGPSELLDVPAGAPIGVGGVPFETVEIGVPDGSWLVLCTDGLVEVRDEGGIGTGLAALCANVIEPEQSPEEVCDAILSRLHTEDRSDDVALLVAKFEGVPPGDVAEFQLDLDFSHVRRARALTREQLAEWGLEALSELAELLVSELVTNAVRAATRPVELRLMRVDKLLVEVSDDDHNLPLLRRAESDDEDGRGLTLVSNLSRRWGTSRQAVGKVVWFELPLPNGPSE
jgi:serine phosphatase RsbU (regulator of sigma subunit)/anti-sigma regulatory factor (Ser/Thr protein kinase)